MPKLIDILERIAVALESDGKHREKFKNYEENERKLRRAVFDPRFPDMKTQMIRPGLIFTEEMKAAVLARGDPAALLNIMLRDLDLCNRLSCLEPEDLDLELATLERRSTIKTVDKNGA